MAAAVHQGQITRALLHRRVLTRAFYESGSDCLQHLNHRLVAVGNARVTVRRAVKAHRLIHLVAHAFRRDLVTRAIDDLKVVFLVLHDLSHRLVAVDNAQVTVRLAIETHRLKNLVAHAFRARDGGNWRERADINDRPIRGTWRGLPNIHNRNYYARDANTAAAGAFAASTTFFWISVFSPEAATTTIVLAIAIF